MIAEDMLTQAQQRCIPDVSFELIPIRNLVSNQGVPAAAVRKSYP